VKNNDKYEIVVWVKGHTVGHRFSNKSKRLADEIMTSVGVGYGFKLMTENRLMMAFGPGMVSHVQITNMGKK
jgi:hypothetical protein